MAHTLGAVRPSPFGLSVVVHAKSRPCQRRFDLSVPESLLLLHCLTFADTLAVHSGAGSTHAQSRSSASESIRPSGRSRQRIDALPELSPCQFHALQALQRVHLFL